GGRIFGGDSEHYYVGSIQRDGNSIGAYFRVQQFVPQSTNVFGGRDVNDFHLEGKLTGDHIEGKLRDSKTPKLVFASVELRTTPGFLSREVLLGPTKMPDVEIDEGRRFGDELVAGFWTIEIQTERGLGSGVLLLVNGSAYGGDSGCTFVGNTHTQKRKITARLLVQSFYQDVPNLFRFPGNL